MNIPSILKKTERLINSNSPTILTVIGVTGTFATAVAVGYATAKATHLVIDEELARNIDGREPMELKDRFKLVYKLYIPSTATCILTISAIIGANRIGARRTAALAAAYSISERAFVDYKDHVIKHIGEKEEKKVTNAAAQSRVNADAHKQSPLIVPADNEGKSWFHDSFSGRYFKSTMEDVNRAVNSVTSMVLRDDSATVSDYYHYLGASELTETDASNVMGWNTKNHMDIEVEPTMYLDRFPCISIVFAVPPTYEPHRFH